MNINGVLEKIRSACRFKHLSWSTEETYCGWVRRFSVWLLRDVQVVMGHASLETTMGYLQAEAGRVSSPLESVCSLTDFSTLPSK